MRTEFLCISVLRVTSAPRVKLPGRKRGFVLSLAMCCFVLVFFSPFSIEIISLGGERELIMVVFVHLFNLCLFGFVFLFLFVSGMGCGL